MTRPSTIAGVAASTGPTIADRLVYLAGAFGLAASITAVWLGMRTVMGIGGSCASGGPYEVTVPCPPGLDLVMLLAFPMGFLSAGVIVWKGVRLGGPWPGLAALAWPALFLGLGWNFLESGLAPPGGGGPEWGWLIPGVLFVIMGAVPLAGWIATRGDGHLLPGVQGTRARSDVRELRDLRDAMARAARTAGRSAGPDAATMTVREATRRVMATPRPIAPASPETLVDQLERLAALHRAGALSLAEYDAAKAALIAAAARVP